MEPLCCTNNAETLGETFFSDNLLREHNPRQATVTSESLLESGYKQITGNDGSTERGSQLTVINAIKALTENSSNDNCVSSANLHESL